MKEHLILVMLLMLLLDYLCRSKPVSKDILMKFNFKKYLLMIFTKSIFETSAILNYKTGLPHSNQDKISRVLNFSLFFFCIKIIFIPLLSQRGVPSNLLETTIKIASFHFLVYQVKIYNKVENNIETSHHNIGTSVNFFKLQNFPSVGSKFPV